MAGGGETKKALWQDRPPSKPSRVSSAWRGGETKKGELKENTGAKTRKTKVKTLPQATIVAGGARQEAKTNTKRKGGITHSPERGEVPSRKRISKENTKQRPSQRNEDKTYSPVLLRE